MELEKAAKHILERLSFTHDALFSERQYITKSQFEATTLWSDFFRIDDPAYNGQTPDVFKLSPHGVVGLKQLVNGETKLIGIAPWKPGKGPMDFLASFATQSPKAFNDAVISEKSGYWPPRFGENLKMPAIMAAIMLGAPEVGKAAGLYEDGWTFKDTLDAVMQKTGVMKMESTNGKALPPSEIKQGPIDGQPADESFVPPQGYDQRTADQQMLADAKIGLVGQSDTPTPRSMLHAMMWPITFYQNGVIYAANQFDRYAQQDNLVGAMTGWHGFSDAANDALGKDPQFNNSWQFSRRPFYPIPQHEKDEPALLAIFKDINGQKYRWTDVSLFKRAGQMAYATVKSGLWDHIQQAMAEAGASGPGPGGVIPGSVKEILDRKDAAGMLPSPMEVMRIARSPEAQHWYHQINHRELVDIPAEILLDIATNPLYGAIERGQRGTQEFLRFQQWQDIVAETANMNMKQMKVYFNLLEGFPYTKDTFVRHYYSLVKSGELVRAARLGARMGGGKRTIMSDLSYFLGLKDYNLTHEQTAAGSMELYSDLREGRKAVGRMVEEHSLPLMRDFEEQLARLDLKERRTFEYITRNENNLQQFMTTGTINGKPVEVSENVTELLRRNQNIIKADAKMRREFFHLTKDRQIKDLNAEILQEDALAKESEKRLAEMKQQIFEINKGITPGVPMTEAQDLALKNLAKQMLNESAMVDIRARKINALADAKEALFKKAYFPERPHYVIDTKVTPYISEQTREASRIAADMAIDDKVLAQKDKILPRSPVMGELQSLPKELDTRGTEPVLSADAKQASQQLEEAFLKSRRGVAFRAPRAMADVKFGDAFDHSVETLDNLKELRHMVPAGSMDAKVIDTLEKQALDLQAQILREYVGLPATTWRDVYKGGWGELGKQLGAGGLLSTEKVVLAFKQKVDDLGRLEELALQHNKAMNNFFIRPKEIEQGAKFTDAEMTKHDVNFTNPWSTKEISDLYERGHLLNKEMDKLRLKYAKTLDARAKVHTEFDAARADVIHRKAELQMRKEAFNASAPFESKALIEDNGEVIASEIKADLEEKLKAVIGKSKRLSKKQKAEIESLRQDAISALQKNRKDTYEAVAAASQNNKAAVEKLNALKKEEVALDVEDVTIRLSRSEALSKTDGPYSVYVKAKADINDERDRIQAALLKSYQDIAAARGMETVSAKTVNEIRDRLVKKATELRDTHQQIQLARAFIKEQIGAVHALPNPVIDWSMEGASNASRYGLLAGASLLRNGTGAMKRWLLFGQGSLVGLGYPLVNATEGFMKNLIYEDMDYVTHLTSGKYPAVDLLGNPLAPYIDTLSQLELRKANPHWTDPVLQNILPTPVQTRVNNWVEQNLRGQIRSIEYWKGVNSAKELGVTDKYLLDDIGHAQADRVEQDVQFFTHMMTPLGKVADSFIPFSVSYAIPSAKFMASNLLMRPRIYSNFQRIRDEHADSFYNPNGDLVSGGQVYKPASFVGPLQMPDAFFNNFKFRKEFPFIEPAYTSDAPPADAASLSLEIGRKALDGVSFRGVMPSVNQLYTYGRDLVTHDPNRTRAPFGNLYQRPLFNQSVGEVADKVSLMLKPIDNPLTIVHGGLTGQVGGGLREDILNSSAVTSEENANNFDSPFAGKEREMESVRRRAAFDYPKEFTKQVTLPAREVGGKAIPQQTITIARTPNDDEAAAIVDKERNQNSGLWLYEVGNLNKLVKVSSTGRQIDAAAIRYWRGLPFSSREEKLAQYNAEVESYQNDPVRISAGAGTYESLEPVKQLIKRLPKYFSDEKEAWSVYQAYKSKNYKVLDNLLQDMPLDKIRKIYYEKLGTPTPEADYRDYLDHRNQEDSRKKLSMTEAVKDFASRFPNVADMFTTNAAAAEIPDNRARWQRSSNDRPTAFNADIVSSIGSPVVRAAVTPRAAMGELYDQLYPREVQALRDAKAAGDTISVQRFEQKKTEYLNHAEKVILESLDRPGGPSTVRTNNSGSLTHSVYVGDFGTDAQSRAFSTVYNNSVDQIKQNLSQTYARRNTVDGRVSMDANIKKLTVLDPRLQERIKTEVGIKDQDLRSYLDKGPTRDDDRQYLDNTWRTRTFPDGSGFQERGQELSEMSPRNPEEAVRNFSALVHSNPKEAADFMFAWGRVNPIGVQKFGAAAVAPMVKDVINATSITVNGKMVAVDPYQMERMATRGFDLAVYQIMTNNVDRSSVQVRDFMSLLQKQEEAWNAMGLTNNPLYRLRKYLPQDSQFAEGLNRQLISTMLSGDSHAVANLPHWYPQSISTAEGYHLIPPSNVKEWSAAQEAAAMRNLQLGDNDAMYTTSIQLDENGQPRYIYHEGYSVNELRQAKELLASRPQGAPEPAPSSPPTAPMTPSVSQVRESSSMVPGIPDAVLQKKNEQALATPAKPTEPMTPYLPTGLSSKPLDVVPASVEIQNTPKTMGMTVPTNYSLGSVKPLLIPEYDNLGAMVKGYTPFMQQAKQNYINATGDTSGEGFSGASMTMAYWGTQLKGPVGKAQNGLAIAQSSYNIAAKYGLVDPSADTALNAGMSFVGTIGEFAGLGFMLTGGNPVGAVVGAVIGTVMASLELGGVIGGGKKKGYNEYAAELKRQNDLRQAQFQESMRQAEVRQVTSNLTAMNKSFGAATSQQRAYAAAKSSANLAQFRVRPSYASKIGLVDSLTRELAPALKPRW